MKMPIFKVVVIVTAILCGFFYAEAKCIEGNCKNGKGVYNWDDGSVYSGLFENGKMNGTGKYTDHKKDVYTGPFKNGKLHGKGKIEYFDGSFCEGMFIDGKLDGEGYYKFKDGSWYRGQWNKDRMHGKGILENNEGKYTGDFSYGKLTGYGGGLESKAALLAFEAEVTALGAHPFSELTVISK